MEYIVRYSRHRAFGNNSAESEPICIKSGTVWAKCGGWPWKILGGNGE